MKTAGVTISGLRKIAREIDPEETVVAYITGNGLKTLDVIAPYARVTQIEPTFDALARTLRAESFQIPITV